MRQVIIFLFIVFCFGAGQATLAAKVKVQWLGHATVKITSVNGKVIVVDPFLTANPSSSQV
ncbi:MAG: hypothetical protein HN731_16830 [Rhodospirillaceae bacterium]|nr:hypothetical protein [Rhodospirillaceae bacterium]